MVREIKIGGIVYEVLEVEGLHDDGTKLSGAIRYGESAIKLEASDSAQAKWVTLWHEVFHAIFHQAGREVEDHSLYDLLAYGIVSVIWDNPDLVRPPTGDK